MGIVFLVGLLFGAATVSGIYSLEKRKKQDKKIKWMTGLFLGTFGMLLGVGISLDVGKEIAEKYSASEPAMVLKTIGLLPFSNSHGAYIVTGENQYGEKVAWYLQEDELFEEPYNNIIDRNMIVFSNTSAPAEQSVRVNVGIFWRWFAIIPIKNRFIIPAGGLQKGKIVKNYKFISVSE